MTAPLTLTRPQAQTAPLHTRTPLRTSAPADPDGADADDRQRIAATATSLAVACLEILSGVRRCETISRWVDPELLARLDQRAQLRAEVAPARAPAEVTSPRVIQPGTAHVCRVSPAVAEVTVIVRTPNRCRAVAVRLELLTARWMMTALQTM
ncbi:Rv3235 family protein [Brevibacterium atlanticum]|uniref:Rv3235 family protein n=1 Tax=Brevibacterium atlanticum TaxID=2697563 RepID=UPI0014230751|nr:Rv3235 family protein [Brevibacterium atlanticum]